ncbi:MAG: 3'-5' exonuclease [Patescibacteria group bacterium]|nr:3'-5' exonuclease [Patescibacteria group bacterium]
MEYIIFDLEATCWEKKNNRIKEVIEIGAVRLNNELKIIDAFSKFVRPTKIPVLSDFCKELTHISQQDIESAPMFGEAMRNFEEWIFSSGKKVMVLSWGYYDKKQIIKESAIKGYTGRILDLLNENHISLKHEFAKIRKEKTCGMKRALSKLNIPLKGSHHRGIDDAKNIAKIFKTIYLELKSSQDLKQFNLA